MLALGVKCGARWFGCDLLMRYEWSGRSRSTWHGRQVCGCHWRDERTSAGRANNEHGRMCRAGLSVLGSEAHTGSVREWSFALLHFSVTGCGFVRAWRGKCGQNGMTTYGPLRRCRAAIKALCFFFLAMAEMGRTFKTGG